MTNEEILHLRTYQIINVIEGREIVREAYGHRYLTDHGIAHFFTSDEGRDFIRFSFGIGPADRIIETTPMQHRQLTAQWRRFDNVNFGQGETKH